ncbi:MAG TPA: SAM-dependent methyltransferase, partial [Opitutales bacterium]|nr:SAM-dependent methyltransferase [Opitutales bacterium]
NHIENADFLVGEAERIFADAQFPAAETAAVIDPPRAGCDEVFLRQLIAYGPARVIYVSCDPATQARDLKILCAGGYRLDHAQPFDLFPQTRHIECVATLVKAD